MSHKVFEGRAVDALPGGCSASSPALSVRISVIVARVWERAAGSAHPASFWTV
jgi:hypothetical protein